MELQDIGGTVASDLKESEEHFINKPKTDSETPEFFPVSQSVIDDSSVLNKIDVTSE